MNWILALALIASGSILYAGAGNEGSGYYATSGANNATGNLVENHTTFEFKIGNHCLLCFTQSSQSKTKKKQEPKNAWHPPLVTAKQHH